VPRSSVVDVAPNNLAVFDPLPPAAGGCVSIICLCEIKKEDDNERK
jgi:hypothetical protein